MKKLIIAGLFVVVIAEGAQHLLGVSRALNFMMGFLLGTLVVTVLVIYFITNEKSS